MSFMYERGRGSIYDNYPSSKPKSKPTEVPKEDEERGFFESIGDFFSSFGGDDSPAPVSGGRGNVVESPTERRDYFEDTALSQAMAPSMGYNQNSVAEIPQQDQEQGFDYSGDVDRYSIPVGEYIPPGLRPAANAMGLNDLSNLNPITGFMRDRDAMARGDYGDAAIGTAANVLTLGVGKALGQPIKNSLGNLMGFDFGDPKNSNIAKDSDPLTLYHGSAYEFMPSVEVKLPDGSVQRMDDNLFDMVSPTGMTNFREGMDVSEAPFSSVFEQMGYPEGTTINRVDPYGRFRTNMIGTGEGGYQPGSDQALNASGGAVYGKGTYLAERPNVAQSYRYSNTNNDYEMPYEDSFSMGIGQKTVENAQKALSEKYGSMDEAREVFNRGDDPYMGDINEDMSFNYTPNAQIESKFEADTIRFANDLVKDPELNMLIPDFANQAGDYYGPRSNPKMDVDVTISNARFIIANEIGELENTIDPEAMFLNKSIDEYSDPVKYVMADQAGISEQEINNKLARLKSLKKKQKDVEGDFLAIEEDKSNALYENADFQRIMDYEPGDVPGNLYISQMQTSDLGRSLEHDDPIDVGTLNDMVDIFGKDTVENMLADGGFPLTIGNIGQEGLVELPDNPAGLKYALPDFGGMTDAFGEFRPNKVPTEKVFIPKTQSDMNKLSDAGYSHVKFADGPSRGSANPNNQTYNYVMFGDDVMPKILDRKNEGGLVGLGIGSL